MTTATRMVPKGLSADEFIAEHYPYARLFNGSEQAVPPGHEIIARVQVRVGDGPFLVIRRRHACPECGGGNFGRSDDRPVTTGGWHGGVRFDWGSYAGVHMPRTTAKRCEDCGHEVTIDPEWD